jgi:ribosome biogenesis protein MAK21
MSDNVPSQSALAKLSDKIRNKLEPKTAAPANGKKAGKKGNNGKKDAAKKETPKKEAAKKDTSKNDNKLKPKKDFKKDAKAAKPAGNNKDDKSVLLREIKAFGGDEKDLDLVGDSDGEGSVMDFGDDTADKKAKPLNKKDLDNDVFKFMNEIGLKGDGTSNVDVVMDDHDDAEVPDLVEEKPKSKKDKKAETKKEKVDKKADKSDKKEKSDKSDKLNKKEKVDERKTQFNQSTSNDIDQIMNEMTIIESTDSVFNASHSKYKLILTPRSEWYNHELPEPKALDIPTSSVLTERLYEKAKNLLVKENELFTHENNKSNSQKQFLSQLLTAGTLSDKIGAYSLLIQESPLHSVKYLTSLLSLCRKKSRGSALQSIAALKDIFVQGNVLPDRKLRWFKNQPGLSSFTSPELLIVWAFEDWLKQYFFSLIQILEVSILPMLYLF